MSGEGLLPHAKCVVEQGYAVYTGVVLEVSGEGPEKMYKIRYDGWTAASDKWLPAAAVKPPGGLSGRRRSTTGASEFDRSASVAPPTRSRDADRAASKARGRTDDRSSSVAASSSQTASAGPRRKRERSASRAGGGGLSAGSSDEAEAVKPAAKLQKTDTGKAAASGGAGSAGGSAGGAAAARGRARSAPAAGRSMRMVRAGSPLPPPAPATEAMPVLYLAYTTDVAPTLAAYEVFESVTEEVEIGADLYTVPLLPLDADISALYPAAFPSGATPVRGVFKDVVMSDRMLVASIEGAMRMHSLDAFTGHFDSLFWAPDPIAALMAAAGLQLPAWGPTVRDRAMVLRQAIGTGITLSYMPARPDMGLADTLYRVLVLEQAVGTDAHNSFEPVPLRQLRQAGMPMRAVEVVRPYTNALSAKLLLIFSVRQLLVVEAEAWDTRHQLRVLLQYHRISSCCDQMRLMDEGYAEEWDSTLLFETEAAAGEWDHARVCVPGDQAEDLAAFFAPDMHHASQPAGALLRRMHARVMVLLLRVAVTAACLEACKEAAATKAPHKAALMKRLQDAIAEQCLPADADSVDGEPSGAAAAATTLDALIGDVSPCVEFYAAHMSIEEVEALRTALAAVDPDVLAAIVPSADTYLSDLQRAVQQRASSGSGGAGGKGKLEGASLLARFQQGDVIAAAVGARQGMRLHELLSQAMKCQRVSLQLEVEKLVSECYEAGKGGAATAARVLAYNLDTARDELRTAVEQWFFCFTRRYRACWEQLEVTLAQEEQAVAAVRDADTESEGEK